MTSAEAAQIAAHMYDKPGGAANCEPVNSELEPCLSVVMNRLRKTFGDVVAVDGLTLNMYRGQVGQHKELNSTKPHFLINP